MGQSLSEHSKSTIAVSTAATSWATLMVVGKSNIRYANCIVSPAFGVFIASVYWLMSRKTQ